MHLTCICVICIFNKEPVLVLNVAVAWIYSYRGCAELSAVEIEYILFWAEIVFFKHLLETML